MSRTDAVIVVDWGTTKVHCNLISLCNGAALAGASMEYARIAPRVIGEGLRAEGVWRTAEETLEKLMNSEGAKDCVPIAVSFSCFAYCAAAADEEGEPVSEIVYGMDGRCAPYMQELAEHTDKRVFENSLGCMPNMLQVPAKMIWLKDKYGTKAERFITLQQYVLKKLGLEPLSDFSCVGQGILSLRDWRPSEAILSASEISENMLGEMRESAYIAGEISSFGKVGLPCRLPVVLGAHDAVCGMLGLGMPPAGKKGLIVNCAGTADLLGIFGDYRYAGSISGDICATAGTVMGSCCYHAGPPSGLVMEWFAREFGKCSVAQALGAAEFDPQSAVRVRFDEGTLTTGLESLTLNTGFGNAFAAVVESLACLTKKYAAFIGRLSGEKIEVMRIGASGAGADCQVQLKADIMGIPVERVANREVSSVGAAVIAAVATGYYADYEQAIEHMVRVDKVFIPDKKRTAAYEEKYNI